MHIGKIISTIRATCKDVSIPKIKMHLAEIMKSKLGNLAKPTEKIYFTFSFIAAISLK